MSEANQLACPTNNLRLTQAVSDLIWNVEHSHVAGWGDCSTDVRVDASFKELKAALAEAGGQQPAASKPPGVSTSASANGSVLVSDVKKAAEKIMAEAEAEARKWQNQGDTHGMNFHQGKWSGANGLLIEIEALNDAHELPATKTL